VEVITDRAERIAFLKQQVVIALQQWFETVGAADATL
jgi:hypothetical protein